MSTSQTKTTSDLFKFHPFMALFAVISAAMGWLQRGLRNLACHDPQLAVAPSVVGRRAAVSTRPGLQPWTELILARWIGNPGHGAVLFALPACQHMPNESRFSLHCGFRPFDDQAGASGRSGILT